MIDPNHPEWLGPVGVVLVLVAILAGLIGLWIECRRAPLYDADERPER